MRGGPFAIDRHESQPMPQLIALELHDATLWEPSRVLPIIALMQDFGYNALVLHQNDLADTCTHLGLTANYGLSDLRLKKVRNRAAWLRQLTRRLARFDARLFLEIKEPSFDDYATELFPDLLGADGRPDPMQPAWPRFCRAKTTDLLARVPDLGGLIVNLSSPESRVSMPDLTTGTGDKGPWFDRMIAAFQAPLAAKGKALYVRDFSYTTDVQSDVIAAIKRCDGAVHASVKITAHDYFPRSPANPVLAQVGPQAIVEVDAFGEHTGWGVIPNCRVAEFRDRFAALPGKDRPGILVRTSWEAITGANACDSLSAVNVFALPRLARSDHDPDDLILAWLADAHGVTGPQAQSCARLLAQSWDIPAAAYWGDKVFPRHSCLPSTWREGWLSMETTGMGRADRRLHFAPGDPRLTDAAFDALCADKDQAKAMAIDLAARARTLVPELPPALARLFQAFDWLPAFATQFDLASRAAFHAARRNPDDLARLPGLVAELNALADQLQVRLVAEPDLPQQHHTLFDPEQIRIFAASLQSSD